MSGFLGMVRGPHPGGGKARLFRRLAAVTALAVAVLVGPAGLARAENHTLNYRDADIQAFIEDISMLTSSTFVIDPRVKGQVTVISHAPVRTEDLFDLFLSTLRTHGYGVVSLPSGAYKVLPNDAAVQNAPTDATGVTGDRFVTEVFQLNHVDSVTTLDMLKAVVNPDGRTVANRDSNSIVVIDYASNMPRVRQVIAEVDRDTSVYRTIRLNHMSASEMVRIVSALEDTKGNDRQRKGVSAVAIEASNTVVLRGGDAAIARVAAFIQDADRGQAGRQRTIKVVHIEHAEAEELVPLLQSISNSIATAAAEEGAPSVQAGETHIAAHQGTNAVVIHASAEMVTRLENVVRQLDVPQRQVLVEALIVEISDTAARELGLQYVLSGDGGSAVPFSATSFANTAPNVLAATGALIAEDEFGEDSSAVDQLQQVAIDSLLGVSGFVAGGAGQFSNGTIFGVILNALQSDQNSNVLATPSILTMDNQEAFILVGQEVPIATGEALGVDFSNAFRTVSRQDVGIKLEVRPQITTGNTVKLNIRQESSSIRGPVSAVSSDLILNKRELTTTVVVEDGGIAVLGGLIEESEQVSVDKVPLLGDIPGLGRLFQSRSRSQVKTNLMVFLRPRIVTDTDDLKTVSDGKFGYIRGEEAAWREEGAPSRLEAVRQTIFDTTRSPEFDSAPAGRPQTP